MTGINIDTERIQRRLDTLWEIGHTERGGVTRLAYSDEETEAIEYIVDELDASFDVRTDRLGNLFATPDPGANESLFLGSHLDTVFNGGRLDGALGVVVALEAIEAAYSEGDPPIPPTLTVFRAEESSRFGQWAIGSRGALGQLTVEDLSATDQSDVPVWQAMQQQDLQPENLSDPTIDLDRIAGFLETHIEQGRVLDENDEDLGVVENIRAPVRYEVTVEGNYDHSGATPMELRRDAIAGGAEMVTEIERIAGEAATRGDIVATVGEFAPHEGAINKVCGKVSFSLDLRSNDRGYRDDVEARMFDRIDAIAENRDLVLSRDLIDRSNPVELDPGMRRSLGGIIESLNFDYRTLPSGGGHDAMNFQRAGIPTGMVFVPSIDGISHSPKEDTSEEAIRQVASVFAGALLSGLPSQA